MAKRLLVASYLIKDFNEDLSPRSMKELGEISTDLERRSKMFCERIGLDFAIVEKEVSMIFDALSTIASESNLPDWKRRP